MTLHDYRIKHQISLETLATASGMTKQNLALIEAGGNCRLHTAKRIVDATNGEVTFEDLLLDQAAPEEAKEANGSSGA